MRGIDRTTVISVAGTAGRTAARRIEQELLDAVRNGRKRAIVDLSAVQEASPGLLGSLLKARRRLLAMGGELTVVAPRGCQSLFGVSADRLLARTESLPEARELVDRQG